MPGVGTKITNLAEAEISASSTDAVTGGQLYMVQEELQPIRSLIATIAQKTSEDIKKKANVSGDNINVQNWANVLGAGAVEDGDENLVTGDTVAKALAEIDGTDLINQTDTTIGIGAKAKYDRANSVDISRSDGSGRALRGVLVDPNDPTSAANVGYVNAVGEAISQGINQEITRLDDRIDNMAGSVVIENGDMNNQKLINVKAGTVSKTSQDAVTGAQLWQTNQNIAGFASDINRNKANITALNQSVTNALTSVASLSELIDSMDMLKADTSLNNLSAQGRAVIKSSAADAVQAYMAEHGGQTGTAYNSSPRLMALTAPVLTADTDSGIIQSDGQTITIGVNDSASTINASNADGNGRVIVDMNDPNSVANVGYVNAGLEKLSDKADISYVDAELDKKADAESVYTKEETDTKLADKADKSDLDTKADKDASNIDVQSWADKLGTGTVEKDNTGLVNGGAVYNAIKDLGGNDMVKSDGQTITIGTEDSAEAVSIAKSDGTGRVLRGVVADLNDPTSSANVGYVDAVAENLAQNVNQGFARVDDKINKTGAGAAALANLHPVDTDGDTRWNVSASIGRYHGASAGALGLFYKPSDRVIMNISSTVGNDDTMFGAGFSVALDKPMANGMSKVQLVKTVNAQADEIVTMKREMAQQKAEIAELKKAVAQMQNK